MFSTFVRSSSAAKHEKFRLVCFVIKKSLVRTNIYRIRLIPSNNCLWPDYSNNPTNRPPSPKFRRSGHDCSLYHQCSNKAMAVSEKRTLLFARNVYRKRANTSDRSDSSGGFELTANTRSAQSKIKEERTIEKQQNRRTRCRANERRFDFKTFC